MARRPFWVDFLPKKWAKTEISDQIPAKTPVPGRQFLQTVTFFFLWYVVLFELIFVQKKGKK